VSKRGPKSKGPKTNAKSEVLPPAIVAALAGEVEATLAEEVFDDPETTQEMEVIPPESKYQRHFVRQARYLVQFGATTAELASFFGVATQTIDNWTVRYREFANAVQAGKRGFDHRVEHSLAARAIGYTFDAEKVFVNKLTTRNFGPDGKVESTEEELVTTRVPVREHAPPDVTACIFWLKNRRPNEWRDVHRHQLTGGVFHFHTWAEETGL
jgi:hypothetical protein